MPTVQTLSGYLPEYGLTRAIGAETARQYRMSVESLERFAGGPLPLDRLDPLQVSEWLRHLSESRAPATVRSKRCQIVALWRAAADDGLCQPPQRRIRSAKCPWVAPTALAFADVQGLVAACHFLPRVHPCGIRRSEWWELAVRVGWDTALRWSDMIHLRVDQIGPEGVVVVTQQKTGRLLVGRLQRSTLALAVASVSRSPRGVLLPWAASHETFSAQFRRLAAKARLPARATWKWVRRGSATDAELHERGSASRHLGHREGSRVAAESYLDPRILGASGSGARELTIGNSAGRVGP